MQLSIIIVNYNVKYFLEQCLCSVIKACRHLQAEVWVVDNCSTDGSRAYFNNRFPQVQFIWKTSNDGFAKANNEALQHATGEYVLFLNPDTILAEDTLQLCLQQFEQRSNIGALGVHMIDGSGSYLPESKRGFPTLFTSFCKLTGITRLLPTSSMLARYYMGHLPATESAPVDVLSGAFMMVRHTVLQQVGSFDETFFMYAEDIDLSYRIQQAGYSNYYFAGTSIIHFKGESTRRQTAQYIRTFYGAMRLFVQKHYGPLRSGIYGAFIDTTIALKLLTLRRGSTNNSNAPAAEASSATLVASTTAAQALTPALSNRFHPLHATSSHHSSSAAVLILSETVLSYQQIIRLMSDNAGRHRFYVHGSQTGSIVSSSSRACLGAVIPFNMII